MIAAKDSINGREGGLRGVQEERVEITADKMIEGCEFDGRKGLDIPWRYVFVLYNRSNLVFVRNKKKTR